MGGPKQQDTQFLRQKDGFEPAKPAQELSEKDIEFMNRMGGDIDARRKTQYINDLKKHPYFKPSMLEPPKPRFKEVSLTDGPIVKSHSKSIMSGSVSAGHGLHSLRTRC